MNLSTTTNISTRIIFMFVCAICFSAVPEYFNLFGDWICTGSGNYIDEGGSMGDHYERCNFGRADYHDPTTHWGYRHWLLCFMGILLFIVQSVSLIIYVSKKSNA